MARVMAVMIDPTRDDFESEINKNSLILFLISAGILVSNTLSMYIYTRIGYFLTSKLRNDLYKKILNMPCEWFDRPENAPGILSAALSNDCQKVQALVTNVLDIMITNTAAFLLGIIIAGFYSWRMTLCTLGLSPLLVIAGEV